VSGPVSQVPRARAQSYYGRPILKPPVWTWEIPTYFFFGGMAGAAAPFALAAELRGDADLARRAWLVALAGVAASPPLLIADLGRSARFHHMLRVVKPTSPMNLGTWILSASSAAIALATARSVFGLFPRLGRAAGATAILGPALSTYTAVLVADTAVPVWHEARHELPFVFAMSSAMSAGSATAIAGGGEPARRLALAGAAGDLGSSVVMERRLGELGEPYRQGTAGRLAMAAKGLTAAGAVVMAAAGRRRPGAVAGGALMLVGALATRWAVLAAGRQSAADPKYVVGPQRARRDGADGAA
jgi:formate-dependent nitrite reductase membrane component NrfD